MYTDEAAYQLQMSRVDLENRLLDVAALTLDAARPHQDTSPRVHEHLAFGVARRMGVIRKALRKLYLLFPPDQKQRLAEDTLFDVTLCLHAFLLNIAAIFDNWAWAYLLRHGIGQRMDKRKIGLFIQATQEHLPTALCDYLRSQRISTWHNTSVKTYRDATAHRIPPYIPPAWLTPEQTADAQRLGEEWNVNAARRDFYRAGQAMDELNELGSPAFCFYHASSDGDERHVPFHQQMLSDVGVLVEFGPLFMQHWAEPPT